MPLSCSTKLSDTRSYYSNHMVLEESSRDCFVIRQDGNKASWGPRVIRCRQHLLISVFWQCLVVRKGLDLKPCQNYEPSRSHLTYTTLSLTTVTSFSMAAWLPSWVEQEQESHVFPNLLGKSMLRCWEMLNVKKWRRPLSLIWIYLIWTLISVPSK